MTTKITQDSIDISTSALARGGFGGLLMGLANLVPGLSGGTMLLAVGPARRHTAWIVAEHRWT